MKSTLAKEVNKILEHCKKRDLKIDARPCEDVDGYVFGHSDAGKAIVLALKKEVYLDSVKAYSINIKKWIWAEQEGFTTEMMVTELKNEIFTEIPLKSAIEYLI
jgi:hypothetical protein